MVSVLVQLPLEELVVEIARVCHGYQDNRGSSFPPWDQVRVVLENRGENYRFLGVDAVVILVALQVALMDFGLSVFLIGTNTGQNYFTKRAIVRMPSILLTEIALLNEFIEVLWRHGLVTTRLRLCDLIIDFFYAEFMDQKICGRRRACPREYAHVLLVCTTCSFDNLPRLFPRSDRLLSGA